MEKIKEFDRVILTVDLPKSGLLNGDIGNVVNIYNEGEGYEVEFITLDGDTIAVETLLSTEVRSASMREIPHVRALTV